MTRRQIDQLLEDLYRPLMHAGRVVGKIIVLAIFFGGTGWALLYLLPDAHEIANKPLAAVTLRDIGALLGGGCAIGVWFMWLVAAFFSEGTWS